MKKYVIVIIIFLLGFNVFPQSGFNKAGRTSLQFLKIGVGARETALGEACVADLNNIDAIFWNPAGLSNFDGAQASFGYTSWFADLKIMSGAVGYNVEGVGTFAFSYISLDYGQLQEALVTSPTGNVDTRTGNNFSGSDLQVGLGFSRKFTDKLSIGVNLKYLREDLFIYSSSVWAFDIGTYYNTGWHSIRLAMSAQNLSSPARWLSTKEESQQSYDLPILFRIGWSVDLIGGDDSFLGGSPDQHKITFNMDGLHSNDYGERVLMGLEYTAYDIFTLRGGYRFNYTEGNLGFGAGLKYQFGPVNLQVDYSYVVQDYLESPNRLTVVLTF